MLNSLITKREDMADQPTIPAPIQASSPPTQGVSQFIISPTAVEILVTIGHARVAFNATTGQPLSQAVPEWIMTMSMSPFTAKQLLNGLTQAIQAFETATKVTLNVPDVGPVLLGNQTDISASASPR